MGFYIRKSFGFGPLRLNLSRSGLGASFGVKGARVGVGPRGTYVHLGRGGLYYRQQLGSAGRGSGGTGAGLLQSDGPAPELPVLLQGGLTEIESADVSRMVAAESMDLVAELARVQRRFSLLPLTLFVAAVVALVTLPLAWWLFLPIALLLLAVVLLARHFDVTKGTALLRYDLEPDAATAYDGLNEAFKRLASCERVWHLQAEGETLDRKRNAGASTLVRRQAVQLAFGRPRRVQSNLEVPMLPAGRQTLYFFPDQVLVYEGNHVGAVPYSSLLVEAKPTRFIETDPVPRDAQVVDSTWEYVNKKGGPDRRFNNNRQLPVALYGEVGLTSASGLNERFQCSNVDAASKLKDVLDWYAIQRTIGSAPSNALHA